MHHPLSDLDYALPPALIAQSPLVDRAGSRLLWVHRGTGEIRDCRFRDLPELLRQGDLLVRNDARVLPARLSAIRQASGGALEVLMLEPQGSDWWAMVKPARRVREGDVLVLAGGAAVRVARVGEEGRRLLAWPEGVDAFAYMKAHGQMPLPPYIHAPIASADRYQTVYASREGAVAAPTAGLHFTPDVMGQLEWQGVGVVDLTLHVGPGTFQPVRAADYTRHRMHPERFHLPAATSRAVKVALEDGRRVVAVGTTSLRVLEALAPAGLDGTEREGQTDLYVTPGYRFGVVGALLTNFHLPRTTLLALVMAFASEALVREAYAHAIRQEYRFYSLGDACLFV